MVYIDKEALQGLLSSMAQDKNLRDSDFRRSEEDENAFKKIERLVKVRDRSVSETRMRLDRDGYDSEVSERAIERALSCSYLDDVRFADVLVRSRLRAGKGLEGVVRELKAQGIDPYETLQGFPDEYLLRVPSQADSAYNLLCRKPPRAKNAQQAAYAKLMRAGYPSSIASEAARRWYNSLSRD